MNYQNTDTKEKYLDTIYTTRSCQELV